MLVGVQTGNAETGLIWNPYRGTWGSLLPAVWPCQLASSVICSLLLSHLIHDQQSTAEAQGNPQVGPKGEVGGVAGQAGRVNTTPKDTWTQVL